VNLIHLHAEKKKRGKEQRGRERHGSHGNRPKIFAAAKEGTGRVQ